MRKMEITKNVKIRDLIVSCELQHNNREMLNNIKNILQQTAAI